MALVYADTSTLFAFFHPRDLFADVITDAVLKKPIDFAYWSFLRYEVRHVLRTSRTDVSGEAAWTALRASERTQARLRWQPDLRIDSIIEAADEISADLALEFPAGAADFLHVAAARRLHLLAGIDAFWTCDELQAKAARAVGLKVRLFQSR
jgi:predicted nucleic acid-binding protein